jgi:hypothetical protein
MRQPEYASTLLRPRHSRKIHNFFATRKDLTDLSAALRAEFSDLSFIAFDYWEEFWPPERPGEDERPAMPDPRGARPRRYSSFADPAKAELRAWREPKGWRPIWSTPYDKGARYLLNGPRAFIYFRRTDFVVKNRPAGEPCRFDEPPSARNDREIILFPQPSYLWCAFDPGDPAGADFIRRAFRIARKLTRDDFMLCERDTGKVTQRKVWHGGNYARAGFDAYRWAMGRRHNYLMSHGDWLKPADYPFTAADFAHLRRRPAKVRAPG